MCPRGTRDRVRPGVLRPRPEQLDQRPRLRDHDHPVVTNLRESVAGEPPFEIGWRDRPMLPGVACRPPGRRSLSAGVGWPQNGRLVSDPAFHRRIMACSFAPFLTRTNRMVEPNPSVQAARKGPYGIRTRAAAVRGRCPRPLDEWAVAKAECSGRCLGERPRSAPPAGRSDGGGRRGGEGRIGLAGVDPLLEAPTDLLAGREQVVARAARRELHHAHRFVAVTMAARIGGCLVERPEAVRLPPEGHVVLLPAIARRGNPTYPSGTALCARFVQAVQYQGLQDHGLQSRPERTKYR